MVIIMDDTDVRNAVATMRINPKFAKSTQKYVSVFRIDGVPILPPLMTAEKRRQMQKLKEKAVKLEQRLSDGKRRQQTYSLEFEEFNDESYAIDNKNEGSSNSSLSEDMTELDVQRKEAEKSYMLLTDLLIQNENQRGTHSLMSHPTGCNLTRQAAGECSEIDLEIHQPTISEINLMQRLQKLQKSETLIYDHRVNTIISPLSEEEVQIFQQQQQQINLDHPDEKPILQKVELIDDKAANMIFLQRQRSEKMLKKIPSICIDPPTPIASTRSFCDVVREQSSIDAINVNSPEKTKMDLNKYLQDEISSEESSNCVESRMNLEQDLKTHRKVTNITSKIIKFENYTGKDTKENSPKCSNIRPPQRSATSPSLKPLLSESSQASKTKSLDFKRGAQKETVLVRSNSFTLDCPSKALIDHIRQQQVPNENYPTKRSNLFSMSATRDTVESKAKRVQKVELKTRAQATRLQVKPSVTNITSPSSTHSATSRTKRSPYEQKLIKPKIARQLKKSVSGTSAIKQMKPRPSMPSIQTAKITKDSPRDFSTGSPLLHGIEAEHRQKFLDLLTHQKREQQRMQQVFENQQKIFLEQLSNKVSNMKIHNNVSHVNHQRVERDYNGSVDNSPRARSEYNESITLQSPTISAHSSLVTNPMDINSVACQLPSLELSVCSSIMPTTSQSTPRRRLFSHDLSPSASIRSMSISSNNGAYNTGRANGSTCGPSSSHFYTNS